MFVDLLLEKLCKNSDDLVRKPKTGSLDITYGELLYTICTEVTLSDSAAKLGMHVNTLSRLLDKVVPSGFKDSGKTRWDLGLLKNVGLYKCSKCSEIKDVLKFSKRGTGLQSYCKACDSVRNVVTRNQNLDYRRAKTMEHYNNNKEQYVANRARRRARELNALPSWADLDAIAEFYRVKPEGFHVDHIIPLQGKLVCGLHTLNNLQYLTAFDNKSKSNKFEIE
jgi:hypothetical protein